MVETKDKSLFLHRSRIDIMACILGNSNKSSRKTRLVYSCNLSLSQFNLYKDFLVEAGLLKVSKLENGKEIFETTMKGKEFLKDYAQIKGILYNKQKKR